MACTPEEAEPVLEAAHATGRVLAVGLVRRHDRLSRWVRAQLASAGLGRLRSVEVREGNPYDWPLASEYLLHPETAGGGVLIDLGIHLLDLLSWRLGPLEVEAYRGGMEAECRARLRAPGGVPVALELSRLRSLENGFRFELEGGDLQVPTAPRGWLRFPPRGGREWLNPDLRGEASGDSLVRAAAEQLRDFTRAVREGTSPLAGRRRGGGCRRWPAWPPATPGAGPWRSRGP